MTKDSYIFKFDLKSGYHHLDIYPPHQTYLGFSWVIDGQERYFCFTVLPFGLSSSPYIFTELLRPLVKFWRYHGLLIVIYTDDGICISIGLEQALRNSRFIKDSLKKAGFVANSEKSVWFPTQFLEWLGIQVHTREGVLSITPTRIDSLISTLHEILKDKTSVTIRKLASAFGKIISMHPVLGSISGLMTRSFYRTVQTREDNSWDMKVNLSQFPDTMGELYFWLENIQALNVKKLIVQSVPGVLSFYDASDLACGAILSLDR